MSKTHKCKNCGTEVDYRTDIGIRTNPIGTCPNCGHHRFDPIN